MSARTRASLRCFDRRRHLILEKGFSTANNVLESQLGQCLTHWNKVEERRHQQRWHNIMREQEEVNKHVNQEHRRQIFHLLDANQMAEPGLLVCRTPSSIDFTTKDSQESPTKDHEKNVIPFDSETEEEHIRRRWPHYRWPLRSKTACSSRLNSPLSRESNRISVTMEYYRPERPRTCNSWDKTPRAMRNKRTTETTNSQNDGQRSPSHKDDNVAQESHEADRNHGIARPATSKALIPQIQVSPSEARTRFRNIVPSSNSKPLKQNEREALFDHWMSFRQHNNFDDKTRGMLLYRCKSAHSKPFYPSQIHQSEENDLSDSPQLKSTVALENLLRISKSKPQKLDIESQERARRPKTSLSISDNNWSNKLHPSSKEKTHLLDFSTSSVSEMSSISHSTTES